MGDVRQQSFLSDGSEFVAPPTTEQAELKALGARQTTSLSRLSRHDISVGTVYSTVHGCIDTIWALQNFSICLVCLPPSGPILTTCNHIQQRCASVKRHSSLLSVLFLLPSHRVPYLRHTLILHDKHPTYRQNAPHKIDNKHDV